MARVSGNFTIDLKPEPPLLQAEGTVLGRAHGEKQFEGALQGRSTVWMLSARTQVAGSASYVALEHFVGSLQGKAGSFVLAHLGDLAHGKQALDVHVVADSGTAELVGLRGSMSIRVEAKQHSYEFDYELPEAK